MQIIKIGLVVVYLFSVVGIFYTFIDIPESQLRLDSWITAMLFLLNIICGLLTIGLIKLNIQEIKNN